MTFYSPQKRGFTILELLIVMAIIGILAATVSVILTSTKDKARDARREKDVHELQNALNIYQATHTTYPIVTGGTVVVDGTDELTMTLRDAKAIQAGPRDPVNVAPHVYTYSTNAEGTTYTVTYCLETETPCEREVNP